HCAVDLALGPRDLTMRTPDKAKLKTLYARFGFKTWGRQLEEGGDEAPSPKATAAPAPVVPKETPKAGDYAMVTDEKTLDVWLTKIGAAEYFAFDTETTSLEYMKAEIVGLSLAVKSGEAAYVPLAHRYPDAPPQLDRAKVLAKLKPVL